MGLFTRAAPWIRTLFPPSGTPAIRQPFAVSDDVQLIEYYQAGGQIQTGPAWRVFETPLNPGLNNVQGIVIVPPNEVWKVSALSISLNPAPAAVFNFDVIFFFQSDTPDFECDFTKFLSIAAGSALQTTVSMQAQNIIVTGSPTLPGEPQQDTVGLALRQTSAQVFNTETIEVRAVVQRNIRGVAHLI